MYENPYTQSLQDQIGQFSRLLGAQAAAVPDVSPAVSRFDIEKGPSFGGFFIYPGWVWYFDMIFDMYFSPCFATFHHVLPFRKNPGKH